MLNRNEFVALALMLTLGLFLTVGCVNLTPEDSGNDTSVEEDVNDDKEYKDCGIAASPESKELECLNQTLRDCEPSKLKVESVEEDLEMEYIVEGGEPESCEVTWKIMKGGEKYSELEGEQITCTITKVREKGLPPISEAYDKGNCESTAPQEFDYFLGGTSTGSSGSGEPQGPISVLKHILVEAKSSGSTVASNIEFNEGTAISLSFFEQTTGKENVEVECAETDSCEYSNGNLYIEEDFKATVTAECEQNTCQVSITEF